MSKTKSKTDRFLVIVESPTKAKHITKILDDAGYHSIVMATKGHIMKLADKRAS
jgi:DNA topoisomerase IA